MIGSTLSHFRVTAKLGEGGMGEVYLAEDTKLKRQVALKVLPAELAHDENRLERFQREAEAIAALDHPNIVTIFSVEEADGANFLTMSYIEGQSLGEMIPEGGMELDEIFKLAVPLADALGAAHGKGITHRDLKPANIMVTNEDRLKVLDFGLAKLQEDGDGPSEDEPTRALTREGLVVGTVPYMSPEQVEGKTVDHRTDIFSLGVLLYEMATGDRPFRGENSAQVVSSILRDEPRSIAERKAELPFHLSRIVKRCLEKDPAKRYQSALDLKNELQGLRDEVASGHIRPASSSSVIEAQPLPAAETPAKPKWLMPAIAAGVLVVVAGLWMLFGRGGPAGDASAPEEAVAAATASSLRPTLAILYFDNLSGDPEMQWLRTGLADMLVTDLSQLTALNVVSTDQIYEILDDLGKLDAPITSADVVRQVAERAEASTVLLGSFAKAGEAVRISVKVQDAESGRILSTERVDGPGGENIFALVDDLSAGIRKHLDVGDVVAAAESDRSIMDVTTSSLEAYRYYVEGVDLEDQDKSQEAIEKLRQAVETDPTFAMALRKLAVVLGNENQDAESRKYAKLAVDHSDRLPPKNRYLIQAYYYTDRPSTLGQGIEAYENLLEIDPENESALNNLALQYNSAEVFDKGTELMERAIAAGTRFHGTYTNLAGAYARMGDLEKSQETIDRLRALDPDSVGALSAEAALAMVFRNDPSRGLEIFEQVEARRPGRFAAGLNPIGAHILLEDWESAATEAQKFIDSGIPHRRRQGLRSMALQATYRGRSTEALQYLDQRIDENAEDDFTLADLENEKAYALVVFGDAESAAATFRKTREKVRGEWAEFGSMNGLAEALAAMGHRAEAEVTAREQVDTYRSLPGEWQDRELHRLLGEAALGDEDYATAIIELEAAREMLLPQAGWDNGPTDVYYPLGLAYLGTGEAGKAAEMFQKIVDSGWSRLFRPVFYVRSYYFLGQLALERGDLDQARAHYQRFLDHWADGELDRDRVAQARRVVGS